MKPKKEEISENKEENKVEEKKEEATAYSQGTSISSFVNKDLVEQLLTCGFSKAVSEKSLYFTGNNSVDKAMDWITEHQEDPDFEEELRIVG
jgi:uncharacterized UBP type Zn finger protein